MVNVQFAILRVSQREKTNSALTFSSDLHFLNIYNYEAVMSFLSKNVLHVITFLTLGRTNR